MPDNNISLSSRIFYYMMVFIVVESILIAGVTLFQFNKKNSEYHEGRLERKENNLLVDIKYELQKNGINSINSLNNSMILEMADVHNLEFELYNLDGVLLKSSTALTGVRGTTILDDEILEYFQSDNSSRYVVDDKNSSYFKSSYNLVSNFKNQPLGIIYIPYFADDSSSKEELTGFLISLGFVHGNMILIAFIIAYFISNFVTKSLDSIGETIKRTNLQNQNVKINVKNTPKEVVALIDSYNTMIDKLKTSAIKLAKSERETAWREMAKQVAHEIKNPLTPMRLSIQHFEKQIERGNLNLKDDFSDFTNTLMQQIDTMSSIASSFSEFATMPLAKSEKINITNVLKSALELYKENRIKFNYEEIDLFCEIDKTQLVRIVNNLISNSINACKGLNKPVISANLKYDSKWIYFNVVDNGCGVDKSLEEKIFEPTFTTSTSGMGLGLSMVKSIVTAYGGNVGFSSVPFKKTSFQIKLIRLT